MGCSNVGVLAGRLRSHPVGPFRPFVPIPQPFLALHQSTPKSSPPPAKVLAFG